MDLLNRDEHLTCINYDNEKKPVIEVVKIVKGEKGDLSISNNEIVFFIEGRMKYIFRDFPEYEGVKGQLLFLPAGGDYSYLAKANTMMIVFRLTSPIMLCRNFSIDKLYGIKERQEVSEYMPKTNSFSVMEINPRLWHFLDGVNDCISDGIKCHCFFEMKVKELLLLMRAYYPKEELHDFFFLILSEDTAFTEYVRLRWKRFASVEEMAQSMNLTHKQFYTRFKAVFGKSPQKWIMEGKANNILNDILSTGKSFKRIALENGYSSNTQFTRFCKTEFGATPSDLRSGKKPDKA